MILCLVAPAQTCPSGEDGYDKGACCTQATPNLPDLASLSPITLTGKYACFVACTLELELAVNVTITFPSNSQSCDEAFCVISANDPVSGITFATSTNVFPFAAYLKYTSTWEYSPNAYGLKTQVWRFLMNGDFEWDRIINPVCPNLPCQGVLSSAGFPIYPHFTGFLDIACEKSSSGDVITAALSLSHLAGCYSHFDLPACNVQSLSPGMPLGSNPAYHAERSYHLVAPADFTFANAGNLPTPVSLVIFSGGGFLRTSLRAGHLFGLGTCLGNNILGFANVFTTAQDCNCLFPGVPPVPPILATHYHQTFTGSLACPQGNNSFFNVPPGTPSTTGFMQVFLGEWNTPTGIYPRQMKILTNSGLISYTDPCPGSQVNAPVPPPGTGFLPHLTHGVTSVHVDPSSIVLFSDGRKDQSSVVSLQTSTTNAVDPGPGVKPLVLGNISGVTPLWGAPHPSSLRFHLVR